MRQPHAVADLTTRRLTPSWGIAIVPTNGGGSAAEVGRAQLIPGERRGGPGLGTERLEAFSDGVFAIAITLLVLDLKIPEGAVHDGADLVAALIDLAPRFYTWVLSFITIGMYWTVHHRMFSYIQRTDSTLLWLNVLYLLGVSFLPFPTSVVGEYGDERMALVLYYATLMFIGLVGLGMWFYATRGHRLVDPDVDPHQIWYGTYRALVAIVVFAIGIALTFTGWVIAWYVPLLIPLGFRLLGHLHAREEAEADRVEFGQDETSAPAPRQDGA
jgi:uncharacterized membrane protein